MSNFNTQDYAKNLLADFDRTVDNILRYDIIDRHTQQVVGSAKTRAAASRSADKRDLAYGAYRYLVRTVYA